MFDRKLQNRLPRPLLDKPSAKIEIRRGLATLEAAVNRYVQTARLAPPNKTRHKLKTSRHQAELDSYARLLADG